MDKVAIVLIHATDGRLYALRDTCPHHGARLSLGSLGPLVTGSKVGSYELSSDRMIVRCPWHGYEFDLDNGTCIADPEDSRVRVYGVSVENGVVVLER